MTISKDMMLREILGKDTGNGIARILMEQGMGCVGCPSSAGKNLEMAAATHSVDVDMLVEKINEYLASQPA